MSDVSDTRRAAHFAPRASDGNDGQARTTDGPTRFADTAPAAAAPNGRGRFDLRDLNDPRDPNDPHDLNDPSGNPDGSQDPQAMCAPRDMNVHDADEEGGEADALAALASDEGVAEVEAPSEESLTRAMPPLDADADADADLTLIGTPVVHRVTRITSADQDAGAASDPTGAGIPGAPAAARPAGSASPAGPDALVGAPGGSVGGDENVGATPAQAPAPTPAQGGSTGGGAGAGDPANADGLDELDHIEAAAQAAASNPSQTMPFAPVKPTSRDSVSASTRISGAARSTGALAWGSRTDVGRAREHNEDSYLINFPLFAVADGMGGHAAGEVASTIAVSSLAEAGLTKPDPDAVGAAIEAANIAVLDGVDQGIGRPGMGTTCSAVVIDGTRMAVGHVGDSRVYLLHEGKLLRVTHDHSFVEELVAAGEITPEEARFHPSRSIITRALGSERTMRADSFLVDVTMGDRVLLCSDGLSSMISDDVIEEAVVTSPAPQACADRLVDLALGAGGLDNVTVIVIDIKDDGIERHALLNRVRNVALWLIAVVLVLAAILVGVLVYADHTWYLTDRDGYVTLYQGIPGDFPGGTSLSTEIEQTTIRTADLSEAVEERLRRGLTFSSEDSARAVLEDYRAQLAGDSGTAAQDAAGPATDGATDGATDASAAWSSQADGAASPQENVVTTISDIGADPQIDQAAPTEGDDGAGGEGAPTEAPAGQDA